MLRLLTRLFSRPRSTPTPSSRLSLERLESREVLSVSAQEQLFVYLLNRARSNPQAYQIQENLPVSLAGVPARPPLAVNDKLFNSTEFKSDEMADYNYFAHQSQVTGIWPNQLVRNFGYNLPSYFDNNNNYLESISYGWSTGGHYAAVATAPAVLRGLIIDDGVPSLGHRYHLLGIDSWNAAFKEIGVGHESRDGTYNYDYWSIHTGLVNSTDVFLTGVVYNDTNGNRRYDLNEGLPGVTVQVAGWTTTTNAQGGWSVQVNPSVSYMVTASGGGFVGTASSQVTVGTANVEVDFLSGRTTAQVNFSEAFANSAPVLGAAPTLTAINEDQAMPWKLVSNFLVNASDADAGAQKGIAVTGLTGEGTWQYHDGTAAYTLGTASDSSARLLPSTYWVRFIPPANVNGQASFSYRAWDRTTGQALGLVDLSAGASVGGTTAFSEQERTVTLDVRAVNDAPVQSNTTINLAGISRLNTNPAGVAVSSLLAGASDIDGNSLGIAVSTVSGGGTWQYSRDGGTTWAAMGGVSSTWARLLAGGDLVRFLPSSTFNGMARLIFYAWDGVQGTAGNWYQLPTVRGGTTTVSVASRTAQLPVNDAPVLTSAPALTAIKEDQTMPWKLVSDFLVNSSDSDPGAFKGMAVTGLTGNGTWQYHNGTAAYTLGAVSDSSARLLPGGYWLRFIPAANTSGQASITYRAWDRITATAAQLVDLSSAASVGGNTSFSTGKVTATLQIQAQNDAPVQPATTIALAAISRLNTNPAGVAVSSLLTGASDVDGNSLGIAVSGVFGGGTWQYSRDGGANWFSLTGVSRSSARLLLGTDLVRFLPASTFTGLANLTFFAWDQTAGSAGSLFTVPTVAGGITAFSASARTAQQQVS